MTAAGGDTRVVASGAQNLRAPPGALNATLDEPIFLTFVSYVYSLTFSFAF